ncbi:FeoB-associated Cys-rich membrane protein [Candidatus Formimonas warabiya]
MINWIIGGLIAAVTIWIVIRTIIRLKKGECSCSCGDCESSCSCHKKP